MPDVPATAVLRHTTPYILRSMRPGQSSTRPRWKDNFRSGGLNNQSSGGWKQRFYCLNRQPHTYWKTRANQSKTQVQLSKKTSAAFSVNVYAAIYGFYLISIFFPPTDAERLIHPHYTNKMQHLQAFYSKKVTFPTICVTIITDFPFHFCYTNITERLRKYVKNYIT